MYSVHSRQLTGILVNCFKEKLHSDFVSESLVLEGVVEVPFVVDQSKPLPHDGRVELTSEDGLYASVNLLVVALDLKGAE